MTKQEILDMTGLTEDEFYAQYPTEESFQKAMGGMVDEYKKGGWIQKATASIKRRGTEGVCTGSKFGGPTCRPGTKRYALAKTFRKMAKARKKEDGGMVEMYADGGKLPEGILRARLESHMSPAEAQDYIANYADGGGVETYGRGGYTVKRSSERKGKTHVVIGPDGTKKYFGDPKMGERGKSKYGKEAFYKRHAKNLKNNPYFRAYARATWEDGGVVDAYQLMGMPTPAMYGMGGIASIVPNSRVISRQNFPNMGMGYGGQVPMYKLGSVLKDIGAGAFGVGEGLVDALTFNTTDAATDKLYNMFQDIGGSTEAEKRQQDSVRGYSNLGGAATAAIINPASTMSAVQQGAKGLGQGISAGSPNSKLAQDIGTYLPMAGQVAGMAGGMGAFGTPSAGAMAKSAEFGKSGFGQFAQGAGKVGKGYNQFGSMMGGDPMAMLNMIGSGYAMGGAVNGPNLLQIDTGNMPKFAMGGMTNQPTIINVEKGELLVDPKTGKILTEYKGGGMVSHPEYGQDERGNVPVQTDDANPKFVITVAEAENYKAADKNRDFLRMKSIMQKITFNKARKEAAEEQAATTAYNKFAKKYGGAIRRMYAKGGMIPMYQDGGASIPRSTGYFDFNTYSGGPLFNQSYGASSMPNPVTGFASYLSGLNPMSNVPMSSGYRELTGNELWGSPNATTPATTIPGTGGTLSGDQLFNTRKPSLGQRIFGGGQEQPDASLEDTGAGMKGSNLDKYLMAAQFLPAAYNLGRGIFEKPWKPGDYETPADLKWEDLTGEKGRRGMLGAYAVAQRNARQLGGSNVLAGLQAGSTAYQRNLADYEEALENRNRMGRAEINRLNKAIQQSNMQMRMNRDYLAQQAREKKAEMIGAGIGNIGQGAGQLWQNKQMMDALRMAYPERLSYKPNTSSTSTGNQRFMSNSAFRGFTPDTSIPDLNALRFSKKYNSGQ